MYICVMSNVGYLSVRKLIFPCSCEEDYVILYLHALEPYLYRYIATLGLNWVNIIKWQIMQ